MAVFYNINGVFETFEVGFSNLNGVYTTDGPDTDLSIDVYDSVSVDEDVTVAVEELDTGLTIDVYDSVSVAEDVEVFSMLLLGLSKTNSSPYDYFSLNPAGDDPITVTVNLDQVGGNRDSDTLTFYLVAGGSFDLVILIAEDEDTGVEWKLSENGSDWEDSLSLVSITPGVTTLYAKAIVANDGTITEDQISANVRMTAW